MPSAMKWERTAVPARSAKLAKTGASPIAHCGYCSADNAPELASRPSKTKLASDGPFFR
jgi:hypothetical protein